MGWFKKFCKEVKTEWERIGSVQKQEVEIKEETVDEDEVNALKQAIINNVAMINIGIERYGMPTIKYGGKIYTAKSLQSQLMRKDSFTDDEKVMCKMMIYKIDELFNKLTTRDEYGYINKDTGDEILDKYLRLLSTYLYTFKRVLE